MDRATADDLDGHYALSSEQVEAYIENGFVRLKQVFTPQTLAALDEAATRSVLAADQTPLEEDDAYARAFLQVMNLWERDADVRRFTFGQKLARIAAQLLGVEGVRVYHDQALYKEPRGGPTPWHADGYYFPLASDRVLTAWVPLQPVPAEMGPLAFATGSHRDDLGRSVGISGDGDRMIAAVVQKRGYNIVADPFELGEVSFHAGWTFHRAGGNVTAVPRKAFTLILMDAGMRMAEPQHANHRADHARWLPGIVPGGLCDSPKNPIVWQTAEV